MLPERRDEATAHAVFTCKNIQSLELCACGIGPINTPANTPLLAADVKLSCICTAKLTSG
jgi:hypothetical protein